MAKTSYYAVPKGRVPGIYLSWAGCEAQVKGFDGATYKKFNTQAEANEFMTAKQRTASPVASHSTAQDSIDSDVVYCDGACKGNGQPGSVAGVGVWWGHGDPRNISERCPGDQTNNRAELIAIVRILETTPRLARPLVIKTDSHYSIQCVTKWIFSWIKNGFRTADRKPVKNQALVRYLAALLHVRRKTSQTIQFEHVRGHIGIQGNEAADQLANLGTTKPTLPERDWEKLEKKVLKNLEPIKPIKVLGDDLKAYADGLLSDDELVDLSDTKVASPQPRPSHFAQRSASVSSPGVNLQSRTSTVPSRSKLPSNNSASKTMSKAELEMYAACLLSDDELAVLGRDGVFDSDF